MQIDSLYDVQWWMWLLSLLVLMTIGWVVGRSLVRDRDREEAKRPARWRRSRRP